MTNRRHLFDGPPDGERACLYCLRPYSALTADTDCTASPADRDLVNFTLDGAQPMSSTLTDAQPYRYTRPDTTFAVVASWGQSQSPGEVLLSVGHPDYHVTFYLTPAEQRALAVKLALGADDGQRKTRVVDVLRAIVRAVAPTKDDVVALIREL